MFMRDKFFSFARQKMSLKVTEVVRFFYYTLMNKF